MVSRLVTRSTISAADVGGELAALRSEVAELRALVVERLPAPDNAL